MEIGESCSSSRAVLHFDTMTSFLEFLDKPQHGMPQAREDLKILLTKLLDDKLDASNPNLNHSDDVGDADGLKATAVGNILETKDGNTQKKTQSERF